MRRTKAMIKEELDYFKRLLNEERRVNRLLEEQNKKLSDNMVYLKSFGENLSKGFNACEVVANAVSHALRLQMNANGVR